MELQATVTSLSAAKDKAEATLAQLQSTVAALTQAKDKAQAEVCVRVGACVCVHMCECAVCVCVCVCCVVRALTSTTAGS